MKHSGTKTNIQKGSGYSFSIRITEDNREIHLYSRVTRLDISQGRMTVYFDGAHVTHHLCMAEEIIIKSESGLPV